MHCFSRDQAAQAASKSWRQRPEGAAAQALKQWRKRQISAGRFLPPPISISPRSSRSARGATRTADPLVQRAYDLLDLSSSSGMAISGAGRGPPPLPLKSTSTACCCGAEVARWEHTRKGANSYLAGATFSNRLVGPGRLGTDQTINRD